jgi:hypothetical protein
MSFIQSKKKLLIKREVLRVLLPLQLMAIRGAWPDPVDPLSDTCGPPCEDNRV